MARFIKSFVKEEEGASLVEYGVLVALIAAVCVAIINTLGTKVQTAFTTVSGKIT